MMNNSLTEYVLIRIVILILHYIGPACSLYATKLAHRALVSSEWPALSVFQIWCVAEAAFYGFFLWYRVHLQREATHPPLRSKAERKALFDKVRGEIHDVERFLSGWFRGARVEDIGRDDAKDFLSWAFWESRTVREDEAELEEVTQGVEKMVGRTFKPGRGTAKSLRLTLDPIEIECRSLLWYTIIMLVDTISHVRLLRYGMRYYSTLSATLTVFPPRPLAAVTATSRSPAKSLSYWLRPHTSKTRLPIVYLHGIGVGLHPHVEFLHELDIALNHSSTEDDKVGIMSIEALQISSRLTHSIPTRTEFLRQFTQILEAHSYDRFVLLSHSYGSVHSTYVLTHDALASRVAAALFVDPVTILLHMPDVAYNFTVRKPKHANEWQLWYFASKDPGVAHTLGRHFFWSENILWRERIMQLVDSGMRVTVSLGRRDLIVDTPAVGAYLMEHKVPDPVVVRDGTNEKHMELLDGAPTGEKASREKTADWKTRPWKGQGLEVLWWDDQDHAQVFDEASSRKKLVDVLVEYSKDRKIPS
ncbi:hypothetical protein BAUCODRAFT_36646 [Baudoinia panamericana UAMH 10762]|uniref:AB hydrolase-1 domain-containing protein n=1 Tax=Baudoinia panamericana (strain UAMH 10762) TaxID=717646 RepID=M2N562_BAUPA|nr:uncharacterized protein BAUCODRAFT_36646 [Baudoinia panamericana UAMH 10762]EMC94174.1 hypothetical protein BAUCODRAFT_36646 [Baudoinia panamericana UAMH 10762]